MEKFDITPEELQQSLEKLNDRKLARLETLLFDATSNSISDREEKDVFTPLYALFNSIWDIILDEKKRRRIFPEPMKADTQNRTLPTVKVLNGIFSWDEFSTIFDQLVNYTPINSTVIEAKIKRMTITPRCTIAGSKDKMYWYYGKPDNLCRTHPTMTWQYILEIKRIALKEYEIHGTINTTACPLQ